MTFRVGLTGGIAGGKSTVARLLAERGVTVVDADRLVAALYEPGEPGARAVAELFGDDLLDERGAVDRERLAERVFGDAANGQARARLEAAIHPLVRERFARLAADLASGLPRRRDPAPGQQPDPPSPVHRRDIVVLEATLLVEAGYGPDFDLVVSVEADPATRLQRAIGRGMTEAEATRRLAAQGDGAARRAGADVVLDNDGTLDELARAVDALLARIEERGSGHSGGST